MDGIDPNRPIETSAFRVSSAFIIVQKAPGPCFKVFAIEPEFPLALTVFGFKPAKHAIPVDLLQSPPA